jgi:hypothetical protein
VFVEIDRRTDVPKDIVQLIDDINNLTEQTLEGWRVRYHKSATEHPLTVDALTKIIPLTPEAYRKKFNSNQEELDQLKTAAGVEVTTKAPKNEYTESLRVAAGIR